MQTNKRVLESPLTTPSGTGVRDKDGAVFGQVGLACIQTVDSMYASSNDEQINGVLHYVRLFEYVFV